MVSARRPGAEASWVGRVSGFKRRALVTGGGRARGGGAESQAGVSTVGAEGRLWAGDLGGGRGEDKSELGLQPSILKGASGYPPSGPADGATGPLFSARVLSTEGDFGPQGPMTMPGAPFWSPCLGCVKDP